MNRPLIAVAGLAVLAGIAWMLRAGVAPGDASTVSASQAIHPEASDALPHRSDVEGALPAPPTPPTSTPLPELWAQLGPTARAGDAPSACRLAVETLRCGLHQHRSSFSLRPRTTTPLSDLQALEAFVADPTGVLTAISAPFQSDASTVERLQRVNAEIDAHCGTVAIERHGEALALLRQAALAGVPDAQLAYIDAFSGVSLPGAMADPTFERWMEDVPTVMTRMLDAGHPDAPALFAEAYGRDAFHGYLFPFDPLRSVAYGQLDERIGNTSGLANRFVETRRQALTPAQRTEADRLTARLHAAHYAGRPAPVREPRRNLLYAMYAGVRASAPARARECQPPSGSEEPR